MRPIGYVINTNSENIYIWFYKLNFESNWIKILNYNLPTTNKKRFIRHLNNELFEIECYLYDINQ